MPLIKAAVEHKGVAFIDVVSPCVAFNNHPGSTKSYDYVRAHNEAVNRLDFMPHREPIDADVPAGGVQSVMLHDGGLLRLRKLHAEYDPHDKVGALAYLEAHRAKGEVVTGLLYVEDDPPDLHDAQNTVEVPLNALADAELVPGSAALASVQRRTGVAPRPSTAARRAVAAPVQSSHAHFASDPWNRRRRRCCWCCSASRSRSPPLDLNQFVGPILARIKAATGRDVTVGGSIEHSRSDSCPGSSPTMCASATRPGRRRRTCSRRSGSRCRSRCCRCCGGTSSSSGSTSSSPSSRSKRTRTARATGSWARRRAPAAAAGSDARPGALRVGDLAVTDGALTYRDGAAGAETQVDDRRALACRRAIAQSPVDAEFRGTIDGTAVALTGKLGPFATLLGSQASVSGGRARARSPAGRRPSRSRCRRDDKLVELQDIDVAFGASNVKGKLDIRDAGPQDDVDRQPHARRRSTLDDLPALPRAAAAGQAARQPASRSHYVFTDAPVPLDALRAQMRTARLRSAGSSLAGRPCARIGSTRSSRCATASSTRPLLQAAAFGGTISGIGRRSTRRAGGAPAIALRARRPRARPRRVARRRRRDARSARRQDERRRSTSRCAAIRRTNG